MTTPMSEKVKGFAALPVIVYAAYALSYIGPKRIPALQVVALFAMVLPAFVALMQVWLAKKPAETRTGIMECSSPLPTPHKTPAPPTGTIAPSPSENR